MPALLGLPILFRFLMGLVPQIFGYIAKYFTFLISRYALIFFGEMSIVIIFIHMVLAKLTLFSYQVLPDQFLVLAKDIMPEDTGLYVKSVLLLRILYYNFTIKIKFLKRAEATEKAK